MADVQVEHGYTKLANEILEKMATTKLSPIQYRIIFVIWRYTYGFHRKEHEFSLSFLSKATNYDQRQLQRELLKLEERKIIVQRIKRGIPRIITFNKNYDAWLDEALGKTTIGNPTKGTVGNFTKGTIGNPTKEEIYKLKKNIKKEEEEGRKNPVKFYEENFGIMTPLQIQKVWAWVDDFKNEEVVYMAAEETALKNPRAHFKYFEKILADWFRRKLFTVEDVLREKKKHEESIKVNVTGYNKKQNGVDWDELARRLEDE